MREHAFVGAIEENNFDLAPLDDITEGRLADVYHPQPNERTLVRKNAVLAGLRASSHVARPSGINLAGQSGLVEHPVAAIQRLPRLAGDSGDGEGADDDDHMNELGHGDLPAVSAIHRFATGGGSTPQRSKQGTNSVPHTERRDSDGS